MTGFLILMALLFGLIVLSAGGVVVLGWLLNRCHEREEGR